MSQPRQPRRAAVEAHAFEREELRLGRGSPWRREATELVAGRKHAVARDDDWHRIAPHRLADIARAFPVRQADGARERAIGRGRAPRERAHGLVELAAERVETRKI